MDNSGTKAQRVTIDDVAVRAGVSIKTVSRVVNNEPSVRPATRERIQQAIVEMGYHPNASARRLAGHRSYLFALVYDDPSAYPNASANYVTNLHGGALKKARSSGYDLLIHPCDYQNPKLVSEIRKLVDQSRIDGLILAPPLAEIHGVVSALREMGTPLMRISPGSAQGYDAVHTNDREVSAEMVRYLADLGHDRIAFIRGHAHHRAMRNRESGYEDGLKQAGLRFRKSLVVQGDNSFDSGEAIGMQLLKRKKRPTAIFAANDDMAAGVLHAALSLDIDVPKDLSVAGFDDVPLSRQVWPMLTTVHQPVYDMSLMATELLFRQIAGERLKKRAMVESTLVIRESTGAAPV